MRLPEGFLITGRGSDKATMPDEDIVWVRNVDFEHREVHATSTGKKASLNANVAAKIFAERSDVDVILHAHVFPRTDARTTEDFAPSTMEDVEEVMRHLRDGQRTVELVDHGLIAVAKTAKDLTAPFEGQPAYFDFPELYDPIYARFSKSTTFVDLVQKLVAPDAAVLDLAAGTGEVALALGGAGFTDLTLADQSAGMLTVAMDKLERAGVRAHAIVGGFTDVDLNRTFDAVVMRQAVTYAKSTDELVALFRHVRAHLRPGGVFVFNAPRFDGQPMAIPDRQSKYTHRDWSVTVHERNTVDETGLLTHAQRATLIGRDGLSFEKVYDLNRFRLYTAAEYQAALMRAGFTIASVEGVKSKLGPKDKAFYVIAR
jgi:SAM-dependent methyltransferase